MPSPRKRLIVGWVLLSACLGLALPWAPADSIRSPQPPKAASSPLPTSQRVETFDLDLRRKVRHLLDSNVIHRYAFDLRSGQVLDVVVNQEGVDVTIRLLASDGRKLFLVDSLNGAHGPEEVFLLAPSTGRYYAEVDGFGKKGTYEIWVRSIRQAGSADRVRARAEALFCHAVEIQADHPDQAVLEFLEAERLWRSTGNARRRANALQRVGAILGNSPGKKDWKKISELRSQARDLYRSAGDRESEIHMLVQAGIARRQFGDIEGAERCYREALAMLAKRSFPAEKATALLSLGVLLKQQGDVWGAMDAFQGALPLWRTSEYRYGKVDTLLNLGMIEDQLGKYQSALDHYQEATRLAGSPPDYESLAKAQTRISDLYHKLGNLSVALAYGNVALVNRRKAKKPRGEAVSLVAVGLIYQSMGDLARARDVEEQALTIFRGQSYRSEEALTHVDLGEVLLDQKDPRGAIEHFQQALAIAHDQSAEDVKALALYGMARAERLRGNPIGARMNLQKALSIFEALSKDTVPDEFPGDSPRKRQRSYDLLIDMLVRSPSSVTPREDLEYAFEANEKNRWRRLLESLQRGRLDPRQAGEPAPALLAERRRLQELLGRREEERRRREKQRQPYKEIAKEQGLLAERLRTVEARIRRSTSSVATAPEPAAISLREAQAMLDGTTVLLEYHLGQERSFLWRVTASSAEVFTLPPRAVIEEQARQLYGFLSEGSQIGGERASPVAERLSETLLGPVADRLGNGRLLIVPDGMVHYVPFAALPNPAPRRSSAGETGTQPLILGHEIVYLPSMSVLKAIRSEVERRRPPAGLLAVFADPVFARGEFAPLPHSREEGERILSMVPHSKALRAFGYDANRELAMSGRLSGFRILHFATHALSHPAHPDLSSIVLSQLDRAGKKRDGDLRLLDIRDLRLPCDLVVLSACKTALGAQIEGEGMVGLSEGFLHAGASRVVASLWNVSEESTPALMERFYHAVLVEHRTPSEALREAQHWMATQSVWRSPHYWAGFEIHGEWR